MENLVLSFPKSDMGLVMQFAQRMGWMVDTKSSIIDRFIQSCSANNAATLSEEDIMNEVKAVRYAL